MNQAYLGALYVIVAALLWSTDGFLRQQLYSLPPTVVVFWEHVVGLAVLAWFVLPRWKLFRLFTLHHILSLVLVSLLSGAVGTMLYTAALGQVSYIDFSVVVLLQQLQPLFAIVTAAVLLKEPITKRFMVLAGGALVAAYFISFPDLRVVPTQAGTEVTAALFALGAAASWGISTAFSKYSLKDLPALHVTATRFAFTPLFALLFIGLFGHGESLGALSPVQWQYVVAITFSTGLVALAIYYAGLKRIPASRSTVLELTWPLSAILVGYFFLGDRLTGTQLIGGLVLMGIMFAISREAKEVVEPSSRPA